MSNTEPDGTPPDGTPPDGTPRDGAVPRGADQDGTRARKRSISPFDPVVGMRAIADIQADGLRAASELLDRMLGHDRSGPRPHSPPESSYTALVDAWTDLLQRLAAGLAQSVPSGDSTVVPLDSSGVGPPVRLSLDHSTSEAGAAVAEVWLHNGTLSPVGPLTLRCGPLTATDGTVLAGAEVRFEPGDVDRLPPRSSRAVLVSLAAIGSQRAGIYRGTIQADGAPRLWLPLEVVIEPC
jgi:hypothetical protein